MKRTNIMIDEQKLKAAKKIYEIHTTKDLVDFALSELLRAKERQKILNLKGKIKLDIDLDKSRKER